jgi:inositol transporter-like SP family MFS transporter
MATQSGAELSERELWKNTILAGLANYIDAGSIVSASVALALWKTAYGLSDSFLGLLGAFSANAISAGIGALIGGRLCDRFGRKTIYQYDMLFYAFGMLWLTFAVAPWMILVGFVLVGLAVGADIPASWSLIAEMAPERRRGMHSGVAQVLWYVGPVVVLALSLLLAHQGILGVRYIFAHLAVVAVALTFMRRKMRESRYWLEAQAKNEAAPHEARLPPWSELFQARHVKAMAFLIGMYGLWNLWAGTNGLFMPYILRTVGKQTQEMAVSMQMLMFSLSIVSILTIFMTLSDKVNQRALFAVSAIVQVVGMSLLALFPLTTTVAITYMVLLAIGGGFGAQSFFQLWSSELFPTLLRSTAQGFTFAVVRIGLGLFSFVVPALAKADFTTLAWILTGFLAASGIVGVIWAPRNEGKSLDEIQAARAKA